MVDIEVYRNLSRLEGAIRQFLEPAALKVTHHFSDGLYARELFIPAGTVLTGEIHKTENLNIMSQGDLSLFANGETFRVQAPYTVVSPPGTKRAAFAHSDTVWTTIHATDERDVDKIKEAFIAGSFEDYLSYCEALKLEGKA
jgi:hypothetical protein